VIHLQYRHLVPAPPTQETAQFTRSIQAISAISKKESKRSGNRYDAFEMDIELYVTENCWNSISEFGIKGNREGLDPYPLGEEV